MKSWKSKVGVGVVAVLISATAQAAIVVEGADGSDGALVVTNDVTIDLTLASTGTWDDNNAANAGNGVYDAEKWAVIFKYSEVIVDAGATVTFKNHPAKAPVVWLVSGDVTINGTVNLNGQSYRSAPGFAEPGPGGFRGGMGDYASGVSRGSGFGIGGGRINYSSQKGTGGSYGTTAPNNTAVAYGNESIIPLIGGSGGAGGNGTGGGGAGAGAILIASAASIEVNGIVSAIGGSGIRQGAYGDRGNSGAGSGGAVRLVSESLSGVGTVTARINTTEEDGGAGRIRLERVNNAGNLTVVPDPSILGMEESATALLWPPEGAPEARIVSVNGVVTPTDPRADFGTTFADVALTPTNNASIVVETTNVEPASQVFVRVTPRHSVNYSQYTAALTATNSLSPLTLEWEVNEPINVGYSAVQVRVVRP